MTKVLAHAAGETRSKHRVMRLMRQPILLGLFTMVVKRFSRAVGGRIRYPR
jgi:hypothetical protein